MLMHVIVAVRDPGVRKRLIKIATGPDTQVELIEEARSFGIESRANPAM